MIVTEIIYYNLENIRSEDTMPDKYTRGLKIYMILKQIFGRRRE